MTFFGPDLRNGLPIGLGSVAGFGIAPQFSPASLFLGGTVQGAWYDPSDSTTLFTDRAGTTPCGTPGGGSVVPVGAMLDKRAAGYSVFFDGNGDEISAGSSAAFAFGTGAYTVEFWVYLTAAVGAGHQPCFVFIPPTNGWGIWNENGGGQLSIRSSGVANVVTSTTTLAASQWNHVVAVRSGTGAGQTSIFVNGTRVANGTDATNWTVQGPMQVGGITASNYYVTGYMSNVRVVKGVAVYDPTQSTLTVPTAPLSPISGTSLLTCGTSWTGNPAITKNGDARVDGLNPFTASPVGNHAIAANDTTARPELRAVVNLLNGSATLATQSVTTVATTYTLYFTGSGSITLSGTATGTYAAGSSSVVCTAGTLTLTVSGTVTTADLRPANSGAQLPVYQARTDANTYDAVGFPRYLAANGTSSAMSTPGNVNLSGTDKATVFMGVRRNSGAGTSFPVEFSSSDANNGSFGIGADSGGAEYFFNSRGTTLRQVVIDNAAYNAPVTNVLTLTSDIAAPSLVARINATQVGSNTSSQGTGNFGSYPLFIGSRNNSTFWLNGNIYSLIVVGSAVSAGNISATEQWVAGKTGITI